MKIPLRSALAFCFTTLAVTLVGAPSEALIIGHPPTCKQVSTAGGSSCNYCSDGSGSCTFWGVYPSVDLQTVLATSPPQEITSTTTVVQPNAYFDVGTTLTSGGQPLTTFYAYFPGQTFFCSATGGGFGVSAGDLQVSWSSAGSCTSMSSTSEGYVQ